MRKIIAVLAIALLALTYASYAEIELDVGAETDFVLNRRLDLKTLNTKADYIGQNYNVVADVKMGILTISPSAGLNRCSFETANIEAKSGNGWNVGISAKATYPIKGIVDISAIGSYRFTRNDIDEVVMGGVSINNPLETIVYLHEYEFGLLVEKTFAFEVAKVKSSITPYIGVVYSDLNGIVETGGAVAFEEEITARQNWGLRYGIRAEATDSISLVMAASAIDKIAVTGSVLVKF